MMKKRSFLFLLESRRLVQAGQKRKIVPLSELSMMNRRFVPFTVQFKWSDYYLAIWVATRKPFVP